MSGKNGPQTHGVALQAALLRPEATPALPARTSKLELWVALLLTSVVVCFHAVRVVKAGGLWRDEAAAVQLATMPAVKDVLAFFPHEAFPLLFPAVVRTYARLAGDTDFEWRLFGMAVGVSIIALLWWNSWIARRTVPLLSLAFVGFNGAFIQWGDAVRGYGLGIALMLLTVGLVWRAIERPSPGRLTLALLGSVACVQCLFPNAVLLLAIGLAGIAVTWRRGAKRQALCILCMGTVAAISLLPYWAPLHRAQDWDILVQAPTSLRYLFGNLAAALSGWWNVCLWGLLFAASLVLGLGVQSRKWASFIDREGRDLLLFAALSLGLGLVAYVWFLKTLRHTTHDWHYLALLALSALCFDFVFAALRSHKWARLTRLCLALLLAAASLVPTWKQVLIRQSTIDLLAAQLQQLAAREDLIVITPWENGIAFERYYRGAAPWMTIPAIGFHKFHRYDLIKPLEASRDQDAAIRPVVEKAEATLRQGHRVWVAGLDDMLHPGDTIPVLRPAPGDDCGWQEASYTVAWALKGMACMQSFAAGGERIPLGFAGPVNVFSDLPLIRLDGRRAP